ncbi:MAG: DUF1857 family protein [Burkholderiales bacterium]|nr:DUF1857 family protein [Burkholderiales bacterium]
MKFEHLVEINDLTNPLIDVITREQLWRGLVMRAESPKTFMPYMDQCVITPIDALSMSRVLYFGEFVVEDLVTFTMMECVRCDIKAQGDIAPSSLRMQIEEPDPEHLFVRFTYEMQGGDADDAESNMVEKYRYSAYEEADIDTIRIIRELAEAGRLDVQPS